MYKNVWSHDKLNPDPSSKLESKDSALQASLASWLVVVRSRPRLAGKQEEEDVGSLPWFPL